MEDPVQARWDARYAAADEVWSSAPHMSFAAVAEELPPGRALDVACGEGRHGLYLAERGWQVTAADFSAVGIEKARQRGVQRGLSLDWQNVNVCRHAFAPCAYDLVLVIFLHTPPAERTAWLANAKAAVREGGTFFYLGHDPSNVTLGAGGPQDPRLLPAVDEIVASLPEFEVLCADVVERPAAADTGHGVRAQAAGVFARDALVRAVRR